MGIFSGVAYTLSSSLRTNDQKDMSEILDANGATRSSLEDATHIISDTLEFEGWRNAPKNAEVVTPKWVERSITLGKRQMTKYYSPDPSMLFSGVCASATDIDPSDAEVLSGAIIALGGQWRQGLTREVTHLFAMGTMSEKYLTATHYQKETRVKILVPHWFDDVVRLGVATIPTLQYEWPDPKVLRLAPPSPKGKRAHKPPEEKASLYKSIVLGTSEDGEIPGNLGKAAERIDVWKGKRILLSVSLGLNPGRREAVVAGVKRFGGVVVNAKNSSDEADKVGNADVLITKFRAGPAYFKALKRTGIIVGNLCWLFHVQTIRAISPPTDQLLHYPTPSKQIEGFEQHEITVTNYTGEAREYLKRLIEVMGANFTPNMSPRNTVVIAAYKSGTKTDRAAQWSIPMVNHTWLEDCFVNWRNLSVGNEKYVRFSPACDCSGFLGDKGMGRRVILDDAEQDVPTQDLGVPTGSIKEVEEAIAIDENNLGTNNEHPPIKGEVEDAEAVNNNLPEVDADMEVNTSAKRERTASPSPAPRKRRRSGNVKPSFAGEGGSRSPSRTTVTRRKTHSQIEVVVPPRPDYVSPKEDDTSTKVKKSASRKLVASESPVSVKKSIPLKVKTPVRKSVPAVEDEEEEEPTSAKRAPPKKAQKRKRDESESEKEHERPTPGPSKPKPTQTTRATQRSAQGSSPPPTRMDDVPLRGRRSAAQKADEKLKDIMPDVINFQKQMKRGNVVGDWEKAEKEQEMVDKKIKEKEKSKENAREKVKETARRRRSDVSAKEEEDEDEPQTSKSAAADVHIMTTKVQVSEDTKKALMKLGAKFTDKPLECTHLIAGAFGRTEKLLSSIAVAPFILRDEWLTKSAAKGRFLPEKDYSLEDRETEAKYTFKMTKTLQRARKNKGKLLEGKTFYLTQKVDVDKKLMKNVVAAHGGTLAVQTPTYRMVTSKPDRHVISCEDDGSIWRAIAENGVPIYTKELILTGILKQEIAWDDQDLMVPGSY